MPSMNPKGGYGAPGEKPMDAQYLSAKSGFPSTGSQPIDAIPGALPAIRARNTAAAEARELVGDNKLGIVMAEAVATGVRRGLRTAGGQSIDPNLLDGNTRARPVNLNGKFVITPQSPNAAQLAAANALAQANFAPGACPAFPYTENYEEDYQVGIIQGTGTTLQQSIRPSEVLVIDTLGITTFSEAAEYELVWLLAYGEVLTSSVPNAANLLIPARRGWPFGDVDHPAVLYGRSRLAPQVGPTRSNETDASLVVQFRTASSSPGPYTPWPHYVEIAMRGWLVEVGGDGLALGTNVGGPVMDANGSY